MMSQEPPNQHKNCSSSCRIYVILTKLEKPAKPMKVFVVDGKTSRSLPLAVQVRRTQAATG
jgi:hypothetical protein